MKFLHIFWHFDIITFWHFDIFTFCHFDIFRQNFILINLVYNCKIKNVCEVSFWHFLTFKCQNLTKMSKCQKMSKCFCELPLSKKCSEDLLINLQKSFWDHMKILSKNFYRRSSEDHKKNFNEIFLTTRRRWASYLRCGSFLCEISWDLGPRYSSI